MQSGANSSPVGFPCEHGKQQAIRKKSRSGWADRAEIHGIFRDLAGNSLDIRTRYSRATSATQRTCPLARAGLRVMPDSSPSVRSHLRDGVGEGPQARNNGQETPAEGSLAHGSPGE